MAVSRHDAVNQRVFELVQMYAKLLKAADNSVSFVELDERTSIPMRILACIDEYERKSSFGGSLGD